MYINLLTDDYIPDEEVIREDSSGLTYYENGCWKFLEKDEYKTASDSNGTASGVRITVLKDSMGNIISTKNSTQTTKYRFYTNYFGLNSFIAENLEPAKASGAVLQGFEVQAGIPLKLSADVQCNGESSVEFSIIDGSKELPILPDGTEKVVNEKMFFGLEKRFGGKNESYKRNLSSCEKPEDAQMADGATYTVSYDPDDSAYEVTPENDKVSIKILFRVYDKDAKLPEVSNIKLVQEAE